MVSFRGQIKLEPRLDWSPLGDSFKFSDQHSRLLHMGVPPDLPTMNSFIHPFNNRGLNINFLYFTLLHAFPFMHLHVVVAYIPNYRKIVLFFVADDDNEYQMTRASKKSIELQTAYVYRKNMPRRHHYSGGEMKVTVINICSLAMHMAF